jgi:hypothetical protein
VAESTCLESTRPGNGTVGSNPTLSARLGATEAIRLSWCGQWYARLTSRQRTMNSVRRCRATRLFPKGNVAKQYRFRWAIAVTGRYLARYWRFVIWVFLSRQERSEGAGPCATSSCEPRQVRKEATVSRSVCVPQDHLAPLFIKMLNQVTSFVFPPKKSSTRPRGYSFG